MSEPQKVHERIRVRTSAPLRRLFALHHSVEGKFLVLGKSEGVDEDILQMALMRNPAAGVSSHSSFTRFRAELDPRLSVHSAVNVQYPV